MTTGKRISAETMLVLDFSLICMMNLSFFTFCVILFFFCCSRLIASLSVEECLTCQELAVGEQGSRKSKGSSGDCFRSIG